MPVVPLLGGAYVARSVIASAQRCVNLYPEKNPEDSEVPVTHYQTPGLRTLYTPTIPATWRGLIFASNQVLYGVLGADLYKITPEWALIKLGTIGAGTTPVSMVDNGLKLVVVDGSSSGWSVDLSTDAFAQISDPDFTGGDFVKYIDGFLIFNRIGALQKEFYSSGFLTLDFDPLDFAQKIGTPDPIVALEVAHLELWLLGTRGTEIWALSGSQGFPFARIPGAFIEHGCVAKWSVARYGLEIFWLSRDNNGQALVLKGANYQAVNITTPALSFEISQYETISDAIGFVYQQGNHVFYVLVFPTQNKTWCYDLATTMWHERVYLDQNGRENRIRANCTAFAYGKNVVGDYQNGKLYEWNEEVYTDDGAPIIRRRGFPHLTGAGRTNYFARFMANIETGTIVAGKGNPTQIPTSADPGAPARTPLVSLRWSDTRGASWGNPVMMPLGATGEYDFWPTWNDLGQGRDRVFELFWSEDCKCALNGAYVDSIPLGT